MQPYRSAKPHEASCDRCAPNGPGHPLCQNDGCDEIAVHSVQRHATQAEYDAIPESFRPIDGYATQVVRGCDGCAETGSFQPFCNHPEPVADPCPVCHAVGEQPCTAKSGDPRWVNHTARPVAVPDTCRHAHREDCDIFTGCQCTSDDAAPARAPRGMLPAGGPDTSGLTIPVYVAQMVLAKAGVPWTTVISVRDIQTQDNQAAIGAEAYRIDEHGARVFDEHGHPVVQDYVIPLPVGGGAPS